MPRQPEFGAPEQRCSEQPGRQRGLGDATRGRGTAARAEPRGNQPADRGSRTSSPWHAEAAGAWVAASRRGSPALQAQSLAEAGPEDQASARVRPPGDLSAGLSTRFGQTRPRQMLVETLLASPPARARPPTLRSARRSLHPLGLLLRRPPPSARARPGARAHGLGCSRAAVAPRSRAAASFHRSPLRPLPLSPPLLWPPRAPATPERLQRDGGGRRQAEGRGRAPGSTPIESSLAE